MPSIAETYVTVLLGPKLLRFDPAEVDAAAHKIAN